ncbi:MAG: N-acetylmuramoyl-L-alanine amidase [Pseudomonadota bacterium]
MHLYPARGTRLFTFIFVLTLGICFTQSCMAATQALIGVSQQSQGYELSIRLPEASEYNVLTLEHPDRLIIDIANQSLSYSKESMEKLSQQHWVRDARFAQRSHGGTRLVIDLTEPLNVSKTTLKKLGAAQELRIQLNVGKTKATSAYVGSQATRPYIIAIDPGHGGTDPGAIGPTGVQEKNVALGIARVLANLINAHPDRVAIMTRDSDRYVSLKDRVSTARVLGADLLISIHADGFTDPTVDGASVYVLSERGASSEASKWLADRENRIELIGGVRLEDKSDILATVLLELAQSATRTASYELAEEVLNCLKPVTKLHRAKIESASFIVLKAPDIPSILVETGFISNRRTESLLGSKSHQRALAEAIYRGLEHYLEGRRLPTIQPENVWVVRKEYVVQNGDSLDKIASKFRISLLSLKELNQLKTDTIFPGQKLLLPEVRDAN